jgi:hypothetical protein
MLVFWWGSEDPREEWDGMTSCLPGLTVEQVMTRFLSQRPRREREVVEREMWVGWREPQRWQEVVVHADFECGMLLRNNFFLRSSTRVWAQCLMFARQVLLLLEPLYQHFLEITFFFFLRYWGLNSGPTTFSHSTSPFLWWVFLRQGHANYFQGQIVCWLQTVILLISDSWVARITGVNHQHWP